MYTLTYESIATKKMSGGEMDLLLERARSNNARNGITGCLIYYMGGFVQVLEGEREKIEELYEKIKRDKRHRSVHKFSDDHIPEQSFPKWSMAYYPIDENNTDRYEFEQFKRNLLLLADFVEPANVTAKLFWKRIKFLISVPPTII